MHSSIVRSLIGFLILALLLAAAPLAAQTSVETAQELISWLPDTTYLMVGFWDLNVDPSLPAYPLYEQLLLRNPRIRQVTPWPPAFLKQIDAVVMAQVLIKREMEPQEVADLMKARQEGKTDGMKVSPTHVEFTDTAGVKRSFDIEVGGAEFTILHLLDVEAAIAAARANGSLVETEDRLGEGPVYQLTGGNKETILAALEPDGVVIMAKQLDDLRALHAAGSNDAANIWDNPDYALLKATMPDLGFMWSYRNSKYYGRTQMEIAEKNNAPKEYVDMFENRLKLEPDLNMFNVLVGDAFQQQTLYIFTDEDAAKKRYATEQELFNKNRDRLAKDSVYQTSTLVLKGKTIVSTQTYTKEYVQKMVEQFRQMEQAKKAEQQKKP